MATGESSSSVRPGDHVQVWNRYLGTWAGDFEVVEARPEGYRVRPRSERAALPGVLRADRLRPVAPRRSSRPWSG